MAGMATSRAVWEADTDTLNLNSAGSLKGCPYNAACRNGRIRWWGDGFVAQPPPLRLFALMGTMGKA